MILGKKKIYKLITISLLIILSICLAFVCKDNVSGIAQAETTEIVDGSTNDTAEVKAEYLFTRLNDTECGVRISNKSVATIAIIPSTTTIDGVKYTVTEITANGFASSPLLRKVWLPSSITKIGIMAFLKCNQLEKVTLGNVKSIGNNAFMSCPNLTELVIPKSVDVIGATILRNDNTLVRVRANSQGLNWASNWNDGNENQNVEFTSTYTASIEYEPVYAKESRQVNNIALADNEIIGYAVASGQDFVDYYYQDNDIIVPSKHPETGKDILSLNMDSFTDCVFNRLLVEYSNTPITVKDLTFMNTEGKSIIINRPVYFKNEDGFSYNVFMDTKAENIILPNNIDRITPYMFLDAVNLTNIKFIDLKPGTTEQQLKLADNPDVVTQLPTASELIIMDGAFSGTTNIKELNIPHNVVCVQDNIFDGWTDSQIINIDFRQNSLPSYDDKAERGWKDEFLGNGIATINYLRFNVSFEPNKSNYSIPDQEAIINHPLGYLPAPQKEDAIFLGWYTENNGEGDRINDLTIYYVANDITLYADWSYYIYFDSNGGSNIDSLNQRAGKEINLPTSQKGTAIGRWKDVDSGKIYEFGEKLTMPDHGISLRAEWLFYLNYDSNGGTCIIKSVQEYESSVIYLPEAIRGGYKGYWLNTYNNVKYDFNSRFIVSGNVNFRAVWIEKTFNELKNANGEYEIYTVNQIEYLKTYGDQGYTFVIMNDISIPQKWDGVPLFRGTLNGNDNIITYYNDAVPYGATYGFINWNEGNINNIRFKPTINVLGKKSSNDQTVWAGVGGAVGNNIGSLYRVHIEKTIENPYMTITGEHSVDLYAHDAFSINLAGVAGHNHGVVDMCWNYASIGGGSCMAGIVGLNYESAQIIRGCNYGNIYFNHSTYASVCIAGVAGTVRDKGYLDNGSNWADITWAARLNQANNSQPVIARLAAQVCVSATDQSNGAYGRVVIPFDIERQLYAMQLEFVKDEKYAKVFEVPGSSSGGGGSCIAQGTMITLADGSQKAVEHLTGDEMLLVWNLHTGQFDSAPILFIDSDPLATYKVINLTFSDGTNLKVISEHGLWDYDFNRYVYLDETSAQYIGHWFNKQSVNDLGCMVADRVKLIDVTVHEEQTRAYSPVTYGHLCYYVNGLLSMPGGIDGLFNIFEVDSETMQYNKLAMESDIAEHGLYTYEEFSAIVPVTEEMFDAVSGQFLKIAIGKGLITIEDIENLVARYNIFFD